MDIHGGGGGGGAGGGKASVGAGPGADAAPMQKLEAFVGELQSRHGLRGPEALMIVDGRPRGAIDLHVILDGERATMEDEAYDDEHSVFAAEAEAAAARQGREGPPAGGEAASIEELRGRAINDEDDAHDEILSLVCAHLSRS